jgi:hypothetical protein
MNTELEQRLRADMEQATQSLRVPPGLALKAYRHQHKRTMTIRAVTAAGAAAVLVAGTLAVAGVTGAFGRAPGGPQTRATAYVISRVVRALSAAGMANVVAHTRTVYPAGVTLQPTPGGLNGRGGPGGSSARGGEYELLWADLHTTKLSAFTATGRRVFDERFTTGNGSVTTTVVSYPSHTWWTARSPRPAVTGPASAGCLPGGGIRLAGGRNAWPDFIRSQLACGAYTLAGRHAVGGVDALEITGNSGHLKLWVNAATYLPMRLETGGLQTDFQWLPRTPASVAMLNVRVPAGFHQVPPPHGGASGGPASTGELPSR